MKLGIVIARLAQKLTAVEATMRASVGLVSFNRPSCAVEPTSEDNAVI